MAVDQPLSLEDAQPQGGQDSPFPHLTRALSVRGVGNPAAMVLRERALSDREHIAQQQFLLHSQQQELQKVHILTQIEQDRMRVQDSMEKQRQKQQFLAGMEKIPIDAPDFEARVAHLGVQHPMATDDKFIGEAVNFRRKSASLRQQASNQLQEQVNIREAQTGIPVPRKAGGAPDWDAHSKLIEEKKRGVIAQGVDAGMDVAGIGVDAKGGSTVRMAIPKPLPPLPPDRITTKVTQNKDPKLPPYTDTTTVTHVPAKAGGAAPSAPAARRFKIVDGAPVEIP